MFPDDFNPRIHNVNDYLSNFVDDEKITTLEDEFVYVMDPYILHRRPSSTFGKLRTFVRITFVPIEINDIRNTQNPLLPREYSEDGVEYRNSLLVYPIV